MGGAGIALRDPVSINFLNPASYSGVDTNSFVFDLGIEYQINRLIDDQSNHFSDDMNFHHLAIAFPITKTLGFATGIIPYSNGYYNIRSYVDENHPNYDPVIGETQNIHKGTGNLNKFLFGVGYSPIQNLAVGINMSFLFGEIQRDNSFQFLEDNNHFNNLSQEKLLVRGYNFDFGVQYSAYFKNDLFANAGFVFTNNQEYKTEYHRMFATYSIYSNSQYSQDTLIFEADMDARVELPKTMAFGITLGKKDKFTVSADYTLSKWAEVHFLGYEQYFTNRSTFSGGIEIIPNKYANYNYLNRVEYRLGGHITNSQLVLHSEQLKEFGITFGVGFPMRRTNSRINFNFDYGRRGGSFENGLHKERFFIFGLSLNFYEVWFLKRKYD